ncbi:hypothetical protein [Desnuesiella massiliensis]|uniref:hypothetical protein n=1 Tax=Desnuesiella massiliensis TaxID=1650662 RepID=UPI0006E16DD5|nr:hypothetical protein [Desnuesiella massiliensis]
MKKSSPNITALILVVFSLIISCFIFNNIFSFIILLFTTFSLVYINGYYRYSYFKKQKCKVLYGIRRLYRSIPIYDVEFCKIEKIEKSDYIIVFLIIPILLVMILFAVGPINEKLLEYNVISKNNYISIKEAIYLSYIYIFILLFKDLKSIGKLIFKNKVLFIEVKLFTITNEIENKECKLYHKEIYLMECVYKEFSLIDLKREKIHLEGKLERERKPAFYDTYILPLTVIFATGILSLVSSYITIFMFSKGTENNLGEALKSYAFIAVVVLITLFFFSYMIKKVSCNDVGYLKSRILVVENLILNKEKEKTILTKDS